MKTPTGVDILSTLIELYAKQESVKVSYKIEEKEKNRENLCSNKRCI